MHDDMTIKFCLEDDLSISRAEVLHKQLIELLDHNAGSVSMDGSAVERIDTACMQLLVSCFKALAASNRNVQWLSISEPLRASARQIGLDDSLYLNKAT